LDTCPSRCTDEVVAEIVPHTQPDFARLRRASSRSAAPRPTNQEASCLTGEVCLAVARAAGEGGPPRSRSAADVPEASHRPAYRMSLSETVSRDSRRFFVGADRSTARPIHRVGVSPVKALRKHSAHPARSSTHQVRSASDRSRAGVTRPVNRDAVTFGYLLGGLLQTSLYRFRDRSARDTSRRSRGFGVAVVTKEPSARHV
jgi:hypothetical protein